MNHAQYRMLDWDSRWFGITIGRADLVELTAASALEIDVWASENRIRCVYVLTDRLSEFDIPDFDLMDVRIEYDIDPIRLAQGPVDMAACMRVEEIEMIFALARRMFTGTRFSRDLRFPFERVRELYVEWARRDSTNGIPGCLVVRAGGGLAGFITGRMNTDDAAKGEIGLLGVAELNRGLGYGRLLLDLICRAFVAAGAVRVSVITQQSNVAACRLYEGVEGCVVSRQYWYHRWYNDAVCRRG